jgi:cysteine desulfurase/selenocysteine lyase
LDLSKLDELLTRKTKMVAVTAMSNVLGTINPIDELTRRAHEVGAVIMVDGAQSIPHLKVNVAESDIDFLAFSGHKIFGPSGVGVLYGRLDLLAEMNPFLGGGHMIDRVFKTHSTWSEPPAKFEAGTLPIVQAIGLGTAIDYVSRIGLDRIHTYEADLLAYAHQRLNEIPGLTIYGPRVDQKGAICSFTIQKAHPEDLANLLDMRGVFVRHGHHCAMPLHDILGVSATVRASFSIYNTKDEVDLLVAAIHAAIEKLKRN